MVKDIFLYYIALKEILKKWSFLDQNHGLTRLKKCFYRLQRRFFHLEYPKRHFPGLYCLKKKVGKMAIFG